MSLARTIPKITATNEEIRAKLEDADLPSLLPTLAYITGDLTLLRPELRIDPAMLAEADQAGLTPEQQSAIRDLAAATLGRFRDDGATPVDDDADLQTIVEYLAGGVPMDEYMEMVLEELALHGNDLRAPQWQRAEIAPDRPFHVAIVGSGMSGIIAAYRLKQAGIDYTIFEKNSDVGGTWKENTYPGCRVDIPNHYYSYSFAQRDDWPQYYSPQPELHRYFRQCVDEFGIRDHIVLDTEVSSIVYDEGSGRWTLELAGPDGESPFTADAVISAVGQLNRPQYPSIEGRDSFAGPAFHSAEWDHTVDLTGKRVGVIGTGCSAAQFSPIVAEQAGTLEIFQRTPNWQFPQPIYHDDVPETFQWLLRHIPSYREWYRFWLFYKSAETLRPIAEVDPAWPDQTRSVSELNDMMRQLLTEAIEVQYTDRPDLLPKVVPQYPPAAKRIIVDNGAWAQMLHRDNVALTDTGIAKIVPEGVVTVDGELHESTC